MAKPTAHDEWMWARSRLLQAERAAGIEQALKDLNERSAHIASAEQYFEDLRGIVFSIADETLRRGVIQANRECHQLCRAKEEHVLRELRARVSKDGEPIRRNSLWGAVVLGVIAVWVGHQFFGLPGAVTGAVIAVLVGFDHMRRADRFAVADVQDARNEFPRQLAFLDELGMYGVFTAAEQKTGLPDRNRARAWN